MTIKRSDFLYFDNGDIIKKSEVTAIRIIPLIRVSSQFYEVRVEGKCHTSLTYTDLDMAEDCLIRLKQQLFVPSEQENNDES